MSGSASKNCITGSPPFLRKTAPRCSTRHVSGDPDLRREVEALLDARDRVGDFLAPEGLVRQIADLTPERRCNLHRNYARRL